MSRVILDDVARRAGVSMKTASRVLNGEPNVSEEKLKAVWGAVAELNYVPHVSARNLSKGRATSVALVVGWPIFSPYSGALVHHTLQECAFYGYNLVLFWLEEGSSKKVIDAFLGGQVSGAILDTNAAADEWLMGSLSSLNVPHVVINPERKAGSSKASYIQIEDHKGACQAVEYLLQLGHRSIGYVSNEQRLNSVGARSAGYRDAMAAADLTVRPDWQFHGAGLPFQVGFDGAQAILTKDKKVSALFVQSDEIAMGVLGAIWSLGLRVPEDVSVVGFDDIVYASIVAPPLTTIHQPMVEIVAVAMKHLIARQEDPETAPIDVVLPTRLVIRSSCRTFSPRGGG